MTIARRVATQSFVVLLVVSCLVSRELAAQPASTASRMQNVVRKFVLETKMDVVGLGSWIGSGNYRDVLTSNLPAKASDHDLRLVIRPPLGKEIGMDEAAAKWKSARKDLVRLIREEFKEDANMVLAKTNLYAPNQVMAAVEDAQDAGQVFIKYRQVPNLGYLGDINSKTVTKHAEGLFGEGAQAWTQAYESKAGKFFYKVKDEVFTSGASYLHSIEGTPKVTAKGACNTALQWIEHSLEAITTDNGRDVAKYLERIDRDLTKSKELFGATVDDAFRAEAKALSAQLKSNPASLTFVRDRVIQVLERSSVESAILSKFDSSSKTQKAILNVLLAGIQEGDDLGKKILALAQKVPISTIIEAMAAAYSAYELGMAYTEEDYLRAIAGLKLAIDPFVIGPLAQIVYQSIESAKESGAAFVGNRQDCGDLMAGIFEGGNFEAEGRSYTHEQLFAKFKSEEEVRSFVMARAKEASSRELGKSNDEYDAKIAEAKFNKCFPNILRVWQAKRERLEAEYLSLFDQLVNSPIILSYAPVPLTVDPKTQKAVALVSIQETKENADVEARMKQIGFALTKEYPTIYCFYTWSPAGKAAKSTSQQIYEYDAPGFYEVEVTRTWVSHLNGKGAPAAIAKDLRIPTTQGIDIEVQGREVDGDYEGTLQFESIRLVNAKGENTTIDATKIEAGKIKVRLKIEAGKASIVMTAPGANDRPVSMKLSGIYSLGKNTLLVDKVETADLGLASKKLETSFSGKPVQADFVKGTWKFYLAAEVPAIDETTGKEVGMEMAFAHASGNWTVKRLPPPPKTPKPNAPAQKSTVNKK